MTWDDVQDWTWHLLNDPIRDNWWSFGLVVGLVVLAAGAMVWPFVGKGWRHVWRRNRKDEAVSEPTGQTEGNPPDSYSYIETPQQQRERRDRVAHARPDSGEAPEPGPTADAEWKRPESLADLGPVAGRTPTSLNFLPDVSGWATLVATDGKQEAVDPADSGVHALPTVRAERAPCPTCGREMPSQNDLLRESIALVGDGGDMVVKEFYTRLLHAAPGLASLFPRDLLTTDETHHQRDRLLKALVALSQSYDRTDPEGMNRLDVALASFGRHHAAFARPDGTVSGATLEEYAAVKSALFETLVAAAGTAWKPEYTAAWSDAYDYAAGVMMAEQRRTEMVVPRQPRA